MKVGLSATNYMTVIRCYGLHLRLDGESLEVSLIKQWSCYNSSHADGGNVDSSRYLHLIMLGLVHRLWQLLWGLLGNLLGLDIVRNRPQDGGQEEVRIRKPESVNFHFTRQCNYECRRKR